MNQIPAVQIPPWRETDREDIRAILCLPATEGVLTILTVNMNTLADYSPETVTSVQGWVDQYKALEDKWNGVLEGGDVAGAYATEYEGLRPGAEVTREDMLKKADVLEWDTETQYKVRIAGGTSSSASLAGAIRDQMNLLIQKICTALSICQLMGDGGSIGNGLLLRS